LSGVLSDLNCAGVLLGFHARQFEVDPTNGETTEYGGLVLQRLGGANCFEVAGTNFVLKVQRDLERCARSGSAAANELDTLLVKPVKVLHRRLIDLPVVEH